MRECQKKKFQWKNIFTKFVSHQKLKLMLNVTFLINVISNKWWWLLNWIKESCNCRFFGNRSSYSSLIPFPFSLNAEIFPSFHRNSKKMASQISFSYFNIFQFFSSYIFYHFLYSRNKIYKKKIFSHSSIFFYYKFSFFLLFSFPNVFPCYWVSFFFFALRSTFSSSLLVPTPSTSLTR